MRVYTARTYAPVGMRALFLSHLFGPAALKLLDAAVPWDGGAGGSLRGGRLHGASARATRTKSKPRLV